MGVRSSRRLVPLRYTLRLTTPRLLLAGTLALMVSDGLSLLPAMFEVTSAFGPGALVGHHALPLALRQDPHRSRDVPREGRTDHHPRDPRGPPKTTALQAARRGHSDRLVGDCRAPLRPQLSRRANLGESTLLHTRVHWLASWQLTNCPQRRI